MKTSAKVEPTQAETKQETTSAQLTSETPKAKAAATTSALSSQSLSHLEVMGASAVVLGSVIHQKKKAK
jgi:hypothetical protein